MKKQYKQSSKAISYKVQQSKIYTTYALVVNGKEVAWGSKAAMESKRATIVRGR